MYKLLFRNTIHTAVFALLLSALSACGGGGGSKSTPEATLTVTTTPAVNTTQTPAPEQNFSLNVTITSAMPAKGVSISVTAAPDGSNTTYFNTSINTTQSSNNFSITNTPVAEVCVVTIKVVSLSTATNTWTGTYRYSAK